MYGGVVCGSIMMMGALTRIPDGVRVKLRRMRFGMDDEVPSHWVDDSQFISHFFNALSAIFPEGEKFFIDSVRFFEGEIGDAALREQIREFARQEGHHTYQHRLFNEIITRQGLPVAVYEQFVRELLDHGRQQRSEKFQLAMTACLEHLTALMGGLVLEHPELLEGMDPKLRPLWAWHAVEETEHKAVAFDVYRAVGGSYAMRAYVMLQATMLFFSVVHRIQLDMMRRDSERVRARDVLKGLDYLWGRAGFFRRIVPGYLRWYKPSFHPWDDDNSAVIEHWKRENARYIESATEDAAA